jgi:cysteine synthase
LTRRRSGRVILSAIKEVRREMEGWIHILIIAVGVLGTLMAIARYENRKRSEILIGIIVDCADPLKRSKIAEGLNVTEYKLFLQFIGEKELENENEKEE